MNFTKLFVAALVATSVSFAVADVAVAGTPDSIPAATTKLSGVTGTVKIKLANGSTLTVNKGDAMPVIPAGATIEVVSGAAVVESGGVTVTANAGDSFSFGSSATGATTVVVVAGNVDVKGADGVTQSVASGNTATVENTTVTNPDVASQPDAPVIVVTVITVVTSPVQNNSTDTCTNTVSPSSPCP